MPYISSFEMDNEQNWDKRMNDYNELLQLYFGLTADIEAAGRDIPESTRQLNEKIKRFCANKRIN